MNAKLLLRVAAIFMLLHAIGHSFGTTQSNHFTFMGRSTSFADFYEGYGITMIFVLLLISFFLWFLSSETSNALAARLLLPITIFLLLLAVAEYVYFFPFAAMFTFVAGICTLLARIRIGMQAPGHATTG